MEEVSNTTNSPVIRRSIPILKTKAFFQFLVILISLSFTIMLFSFKKENYQSSSLKETHLKPCIPFKGKFTILFTENGPVSTGVGTHVGKFTAVGTSSNATLPYIDATTTSTTANGDQIFTTDIGFATNLGNGLYDVHIHCTISGGTGRFDGATGSYETYAIINLVLGTGSATFDGTICY